MTTGPRPTPYPIVLHVNESGKPVRLAEASSIYVTTVSAVSISATNYLGLGGAGRPEGPEKSIQFKSNNAFAGEEGFTYDNDTFTLNVLNINSNNTITADNLRSDSASSTNLSAINIRAITLSATTVCATNYDTLLDALSFQNLDNRYLNSSGDSVTGSIYIQTLSSTNLSATNWLGLPSGLATWNASAIQGIAVTSTQPTLGQSLVYKDGIWQPSSIAGVGGGSPGGDELSIQFRNGSFFSGVGSIKYNSSISGIQSVGLSSTTIRSNTLIGTTVCATVVSATTYQNLGEDTAQWNASKIYGTPFNKGELITGDFISYEGGSWTNVTKGEAAALVSPQLHTETWNASAIKGASIVNVDTNVTGTTIGAFIYSRTNNQYYTLPFSSVVIAGSRDVGTLPSINPQGQIVASYLGSATSSLQINPIFATLGINDYPENKDVLVFSSNLYGYGVAGGWTWVQPSTLVPAQGPYAGHIQIKGPDGQFSSIQDFRHTNDGLFLPKSLYLNDSDSYLRTKYLDAIGNINVFGGINASGYINLAGVVSATRYNLFGAETSATFPLVANNQTIVYDSPGQRWKPGYKVFQATATPTAGIGSNGDIYFQYLP